MWSIITIISLHLIIVTTSDSIDLTQDPGHLKPFGSGRPSTPIAEFDGFPDPRTFFTDYVIPQKAVKLRGAGRLSRAYERWGQDEYFLSLDIPADHEVFIESKKKENRSQPTSMMHFHEFLKIYNTSDQYMVQGLPPFLAPDLLLPCSVQCDDLLEMGFIEAVTWISSGGTKSVVHTDAVENINCLFRGKKKFIIIDYEYEHMVDLDRPEGSYADIDVDSVDYTKYPGLAEVEFQHVDLEPGDCLYLPYRLIHQVRSYDSNVAVNIWWDHYKNDRINLDRCKQECDTSLTMDKVKFSGFDTLMDNIGSVRDHILALIGITGSTDQDKFVRVFLGPDEPPHITGEQTHKVLVAQIFHIMDENSDGILRRAEVEAAAVERFEKVSEKMGEIDDFLKKLEDEADEEYYEEDEEDRRDEL